MQAIIARASHDGTRKDKQAQLLTSKGFHCIIYCFGSSSNLLELIVQSFYYLQLKQSQVGQQAYSPPRAHIHIKSELKLVCNSS
jgi:hypothetical protein